MLSVAWPGTQDVMRACELVVEIKFLVVVEVIGREVYPVVVTVEELRLSVGKLYKQVDREKLRK
jgi:hypothetical protein